MRTLALRTSPPDLEVPARRLIERWGAEPDLEKLCAITNEVFGTVAPARQIRIMAYSLWRFTWLKGVEIAERLGRTPGAISQSVRYRDERLHQQPELGVGFEEIERWLRQVPSDSELPDPMPPSPGRLVSPRRPGRPQTAPATMAEEQEWLNRRTPRRVTLRSCVCCSSARFSAR